MKHFPWIACLLLFAMLASGRAGTLVQFHTAFGNMAVELYDQDKPATVQNFISYIRSGRYTNEFSHRLVPGFVLQAGGFTVTNRGTTNWATIPVPTYPPVTNEFNTGQFYSNLFGTIAMAKTTNANSATSQFFFNLTNNSASLDNTNNSGGFTVFGHVVAGTNVLAMFNNFQYWLPQFGILPQPTNLVLYQYYSPPFDTLPLLYPSIIDSNFLYIDISLPSIQIAALTNRACAISWTSTAGMTNYVEFTTNLPPVWQVLFATNGNGAPMQWVDTTTNPPSRFYHVRVAD
jgi:cyclophilin family peptidyl-prolyl cis-trans isomerase